MKTVAQIGPEVGVQRACEALAIARSSYYRRQSPRPPSPEQPRPTPARALSIPERAEVLAVLNSDRFVDCAPPQVYATLLDEGRYLCSERTMYRILADADEVRERRNQRQHAVYGKPELVATGPNQVWSWDITKLRLATKWTYALLYVVLDVFSRYVVGWLISMRESAALAQRLIEESCHKQGVVPGQLTVHSDRGAPMVAKTMTQLLADLGIEQSFSRPRISNDNPYSESQFRTMKYRPTFPDRFASDQHARVFCLVFFPWYNTQHRHSGIAMMTPEDVHYGRAEQILRQRKEALEAAFKAHPERFVNKKPEPLALPQAVYINPPAKALAHQNLVHAPSRAYNQEP